MDIAPKKRRVYQRSYYERYRFFSQQRRYFIEVHEKALEQQKKERESVDRFILCFD